MFWLGVCPNWLLMDDAHPTNWFILKPSDQHLYWSFQLELVAALQEKVLECDDHFLTVRACLVSSAINSWHFMIPIVGTLTIQTDWLHFRQIRGATWDVKSPSKKFHYQPSDPKLPNVRDFYWSDRSLGSLYSVHHQPSETRNNFVGKHRLS